MTAYLINHVQKTFDLPEVIGDTLRNEELGDTDKWKPELEVSTNTDDNNTATENKMFELEYKIEYTKWLNNTEIYKTNLIKAYAFLWEHCSKGMQNKIESRSDYTEIVNNPVKLLKAIKEHALNYQKHRYDMSIIADAVMCFMMTKQQENESLSDYTKLFHVSMEVMEPHIGDKIRFKKVCETEKATMIMTKGAVLDANEEQEVQDTVFKRFAAYVYL